MDELMRRRRALMAAQGGGDWKSDYVQDGILMWLDGEHNSTDGTHDSNLARWRDQSGNGYDWNLGGTFEVGSKYIGVSGSGYGVLIGEKGLPPSPRFCEIVLSKSGSIGNGGYEFIYGGYGNSSNPHTNIFLVRKSSVDSLTFGSLNAANGVVPRLNGKTTYYNSDLYVNNQKTANTNITDSWGKVGKLLFQYEAGGYKFAGRLFALRVYNRTLTESEVLRNFAADRKRFGIEVSA